MLNRPRIAAKALVEELEGEGVSADRYVLATYAAIQAWAQAASGAGDTSFDPVVAALDEGTFDTILGPVSFNAKGDADHPGYVWFEWQDGAPVRGR